MPLYFLQAFGHQHGVLAPGDADRNPVPRLDKLVPDDGLREGREQPLPEFPTVPDRLRDFLGPVGLHELLFQPRRIAARQTVRVVSEPAQLFAGIRTLRPVHAEQHEHPVPRQKPPFRVSHGIRMALRAGDGAVGKGDIVADIV